MLLSWPLSYQMTESARVSANCNKRWPWPQILKMYYFLKWRKIGRANSKNLQLKNCNNENFLTPQNNFLIKKITKLFILGQDS